MAITRRELLTTAAGAALGAAGLRPARAAGAAKGRPNILFVMTDQQRWDMLSCVGNTRLRTPAVDALAASGMRFDLAFTPNPVCMAARASLITGRMPSDFGVPGNQMMPAGYTLDPAATLGQVFQRAGYETAYSGKTHFPFRFGLPALGFTPLRGDQREKTADACVDFLKQPHDRPFFLFASLINPHDICYLAVETWFQTAPVNELYALDPAKYTQPHLQALAASCRMPAGGRLDEFIEKECPPLPANFAPTRDEAEAVTHHESRVRTKTWDERKWRLHRWAYLRLTEQVDAQIGRVLAALKESGLEENTLVVFLSDHGDSDGSHGLEHKSVLYEEATHVPFIMRWPGHTTPGSVDRAHFVSTGLDLLPTLCDCAGIDPPAGLPGRSLRTLAEGRVPGSWRQEVLSECQTGDSDLSWRLFGRMVRTARHKYVTYPRGAHREMLFDLEKDPGELTNLAGAPAYQAILADLRGRVRGPAEM